MFKTGMGRALAAAAVALVVSAGSAQAAVITFEGIAPAGAQTTEDGTNQVFAGFNVFVPHGHYQDAGFLAPVRPDNGTDWLLHDHFSGTLGAPVVITKVGGGTFSFQSIDTSEWENTFSRGQTLTLTGHVQGGGIVMQQFVTDQVFGFQTFSVGSWGNLVSLDVIGSTNGTTFGTLGYDNVVLDASVVPEPMTMSLLGLGLAGLVARRRRA